MLFYKLFSSFNVVGAVEVVSWCVIAALHFPRYVFAVKAFIYINNNNNNWLKHLNNLEFNWVGQAIAVRTTFGVVMDPGQKFWPGSGRVRAHL